MSSIIYRYLDQYGGEESIFNNTLKFSKHTDFNDPFDCYIRLIELDSSYESISHWANKGFIVREPNENQLSHEQWINKIIGDEIVSLDNPEMINIFETVLDQLLICCFSRRKSNITMWSHYAEKHNGFCIGYDKDILIEYLGSSLRSVVYCSDFFKQTYSYKSGITPLEHITSIKSIEWAQEEEERMILKTPNLQTTFNKDNSDSGIYSIPSEAIKEIYLGQRNNFSIRKIEQHFHNQKKNIPKIKKMSLSSSSFSLITTS